MCLIHLKVHTGRWFHCSLLLCCKYASTQHQNGHTLSRKLFKDQHKRAHELSWLSTERKTLITALLSQFGAVRHEILIYQNSTKQFKNLKTSSSVAVGSTEYTHLSQSLLLPTAPYALLWTAWHRREEKATIIHLLHLYDLSYCKYI